MTCIQDISDIRIGFPGQPDEAGEALFFQVRQFNDEGVLNSELADHTNLDDKSSSHVLMDGDVLFVGKGSRLFAWCYPQTDKPAIASSSFFVLRPYKSKILPEYLAAILNAPQTQAAFLQLGAGSNIFSIRKSELGAFQIPVLPLEKQRKLVALASLHQREIQLAKELITQKQTLYTAIISKLIK